MESKHGRELAEERKACHKAAAAPATGAEGGGADSAATEMSPAVVALRQGYNQTYVVRSAATGAAARDGGALHDVLFRCGNWCYGGLVDLGGARVELADVPAAIPALQKQQASLQYLGEWRSLPRASPFAGPLEALYDALDFLGAELASAAVERALLAAADEHAWVAAALQGDGDANADGDGAADAKGGSGRGKDAKGGAHFFELQTSGLPGLEDGAVDFAASKTFVRGLVLLAVYYQRSVFVVLQDGAGEQPLLDVRFPDMAAQLEGVHLRAYRQSGREGDGALGDGALGGRAKTLTLWQAGAGDRAAGRAASPARPLRLQCKDVGGGAGYTQTFLIRRGACADKTNSLREVLFRFGNWCYNGHVDLGPRLELADIPVIIPMLRRQQSALTFMCEVSKMPATSLFTACMAHLAELVPALQGELAKAEKLVRAQAGEAAGRAADWLEDDDAECFFELGVDKCEALENVEAIASKVYLGGVVLVLLYFDYTFYVYLESGEEEQPLLDTAFPDVSFQKEGLQIKTYRGGVPGCPELRRLSLWRVAHELASDSDDEGGAAARVAALDGARADAKATERRPEEGAKDKAVAPKAADALARKAALPHHIAPLRQASAGGSAALKKVPDLGLKAPWDETGRPLGLRAGK